MAYLRGEWYVYEHAGDDCMHFHGPLGQSIAMPMALFDALVAMRWARMDTAEREAAVTLAVERYGGNFGADALNAALGLPTVIDSVRLKLAQNEGLIPEDS